MVEYARQSSTCAVVEGFHLDPHDKATCFEWIQRYPFDGRRRGNYGYSVDSSISYDMFTYRIVPK